MFIGKRYLFLEFIFISVCYCTLIFFLAPWIQVAHETGLASAFSSDAPVYYSIYSEFIRDIRTSQVFSNARFWELCFNKAPAVLLIIFNGSVANVVAFSGLIALCSMYSCLAQIQSIVVRRRFYLLLFLVPYFSFGFFALNKEIFVGSAILLLLAYLTSGRGVFLWLAIIIALLGRPLFLVVMLTGLLYYRFYRERQVVLGALFFIFTILPFSGIEIPGAPNFELHKDGGTFSKLMTSIIHSGGYILAYPFKYFGNIILKLRTVGIGNILEDFQLYLNLGTSVTFLIQILIVAFYWKLIRTFYVGRLITFYILFLPVVILYFNFSQVRYFYFVQILCVFLIAYIPSFREKKRATQDLETFNSRAAHL